MVQNPKKKEAIRLRLDGKSYGEIIKKLDLSSKGILSFWFKGLKLPPETRKRLKKNMLLARDRGLLAFNQNRSRKIKEENDSIFSQATDSINTISDKELLLIGSALYWGEGTINHGRYNYPYLSFSNSNPKMTQVYIAFLKRILKVKEEKIHGGIQIHPNIKEKPARKFWSKVTGIPEKKFHITRQISRASKFKRDKKFLPYGTVKIVVARRQLFYQVQGYINGIAKQLTTSK